MLGNLHTIAVGQISAVNPQLPCEIRYSEGVDDTLPDGTQVPKYSDPERMMAQVQSLTYKDLEHIDSLNVQGTRRSIYLWGSQNLVVRVTKQGGDLIQFPGAIPGFPPGTIWLVVLVPDTYQGWCHTICTLQNQLMDGAAIPSSECT